MTYKKETHTKTEETKKEYHIAIYLKGGAIIRLWFDKFSWQQDAGTVGWTNGQAHPNLLSIDPGEIAAVVIEEVRETDVVAVV